MKAPELFAGLPVPACKQILSAACPKNFASLETIFWVGDPIKEIFLLTEGQVKITQQSKNGIEVILRLHLRGQLVGPIGLAPGGNHSSTAQALEACRTWVWSAETFEALLERFPLLRRNAQDVVAWQTWDLSRRVCDISTEAVPPRLAHGLLYLLGQMGRKVNGNFELKVTQEMLAQMTGMTFYTANRQLSIWEQQGLVICRRGSIVIRDCSRLACL